MITLYRADESIMLSFLVNSVKKAVEFAVKQGLCLANVNLEGANLEGANFTGAYFDFAAISLQCKSTEAIIDDRFAAQLAHLLTRQDYSNCSEEVRKEIEQIKSMNLTNLLAKYRNDVKPI